MHIINVERFGGPEALELIEQPAPAPMAGQISLTVKASGINYADVLARAGKYRGVPAVPFNPGFEVAGVVDGIGESVEGFAIGDRVMGIVPGGGYATNAVLDAKSAIKIPPQLGFDAASALLIQGLTAYFLLEHGGAGVGKTVLVSSASGGLGSLAVQIAKLKGASTVIGLASQNKHDRAKSLGADFAVDYTKPEWGKAVLAGLTGGGVDIFLDSLGDLAGDGFDTLAYGAKWLIFGGQAGSGDSLTPGRLGVIIAKNITLRGYNLFFDAANFGRGLTELICWAADGKLKIDVQSFPLARAADAHKAMSERKTSGKVVLTP